MQQAKGWGRNKQQKHNSFFMKEWIDVDERLPDFDTRVLWCMESGYVFIDEIDHDNEWEIFYGSYQQTNGDYITHWMPLPDYPQ